MDNPKIRVMIVDDHDMVRRGLAAFLKAKSDLELVGEARDGREALQVCEHTRPDVILMDLIMPKIGGAETTQIILKNCPDALLNGHKEDRLPNTANISFEFVEGEAILLMLNQFGICASSGSACTSGTLEPSHVLRAMGVPFTAAHGSIRFSLSRYTTEQEVDFVAEKLPPIINRLRELSPFITK